MKVFNKETGEEGNLVVRKVGGHKNAEDIRVFSSSGIKEYSHMRDVFSVWAVFLSEDKKKCVVKGCSASPECKNLCKKHWTRLCRHGDVGDIVCSRLNYGLYSKYPREYKSWDMMKQRCYNKRYDSYPQYGKRGIRVCDRWLKTPDGFKNFIADMGERPKGCSLDRIDVNGDYCPENCRWANGSIQGYNKRVRLHSSKYRGVGEYDYRGKKVFRAFISYNGEFRQKEFPTEWEALLQRVEWVEEFYPDEKKTMEELIASVALWGRKRGINNVDKQFQKVSEEVAEIARCLVRSDYSSPELIDAIGDSFVTIIVLSDILGMNPIDCLESALEEISDRKGKTVDGSFIKNE